MDRPEDRSLNRHMNRTERAEAQRRVEVDEALLRGVRTESTRLRARLRMLEGEIAGHQQAISEKERLIRETVDRIEDLRDRLSRLDEQQHALEDDQATWNGRLAG